ncbi:unnamed protein product [Brassica rapa]|uniref:F-box associated beta-propeller type 3 domain-containing protein n=1 Tax=Brassica campestris TaxID=3711 RepID=A0A3P5ZE68_BRACM|nr:unnamed protein product [Brassica rapa]VDC71071.1 unnamed protein product [Brassica rapa]
MSCRTIECGTPHSPSSGGVCISGVLYYKAADQLFSKVSMIVCFDVRSEKYNFVRVRESSIGAVDTTTTLINYKGKLASLMMERSYSFWSSISFDMWVLQDPEKQEWSKHTYKFPILSNEVREDTLYCVRVSGTNEIVLFPKYVSDPFYIFYYNLQKKTSRRVEIQGIRGKKVYTFLDHIEDAKLT